jgi:hypothetical protein
LTDSRQAVERTTVALSTAVVLLASTSILVFFEPQFLSRTATSTTVTTTTQTVTETASEGFTTIITRTLTSSGATTCVDLGPPGPLFLGVVSDSAMAPVSGANVTAMNRPLLCGNGQPLDDNVTIIFTTGGAKWYSLSHGADASFSLAVRYAGRIYTFTVDLHPEAATCATLFVPSGRTNVTSSATFQFTCT